MVQPRAERRKPPVVDGQTVVELLIPVQAEQWHDRGVSLAIPFAAAWHVPMRLVHIRRRDEPASDGSSSVDALVERMRAAHPGVMIDGAEIEHDDVAGGIRSTAVGGSLVVLATDNVSADFGVESAGEQIVRALPGAAMLLGPHCEQPNPEGSVVVGFDGSPTSDGAVAAGRSWMRGTDATLWLVSVADSATVEHIERMKEQGQRVSVGADLRSLAARVSAAEADSHVAWELIQSDDVVGSLVRFAADHRSSVIVAATQKRSPFASRLFGSVCLGLAERATAPVLVVKTTPGIATVDDLSTE